MTLPPTGPAPVRHAPVRVGLAMALAGLMGLASLGCAPTSAPPKAPGQRVFRLNLGTEPPDLDPIRVADLTSMTPLLQLNRGLTQLDAQGQVAPALAQRWTVSPDGKTYRFHLRPTARWSDGRPVTAQDVVYGWQRALTGKNGAEYAFFLFDVHNARAFYNGQVKDFSRVGVQALDHQTVQVTLDRPVAFFLSLVAAPVAFPMRQDRVEAAGDRLAEPEHWLSNGPYVLSRWEHESLMVLTPNPHYDGPRPGVDRVEMRMVNDANTSVVLYESGDLDYIETPSSIPAFDVRRLRKRPDYHRGTLQAVFYVGFNTQKPPFNDPRVRRAFALSVDRQLIPKLMQSGQRPIQNWLPPGLVGSDAPVGLGYDPAEARRLLAEAGYPGGRGLPPVTLAFRSLYDVQKEAEILQFSWQRALGVPVRLANMDWKVFLGQLRLDPPPMYRLTWYVDYPDSDSLMTLFLADNGNNHTRWSDPRYDRWVREAAQTRDPALRRQLYTQAQRLLLEEQAVIIPLYVPEKGYLLAPRCQGVTVNPLNLINLDRLNCDPS